MTTDKHRRDEVDEVAALLALDALEPDEQADAELRYGSFPQELADVTLPLAESVATAPPQGSQAPGPRLGPLAPSARSAHPLARTDLAR